MPPSNPNGLPKVIAWGQLYALAQDIYLQNVAFFFPEARSGLEHRLDLASLVSAIREYAIKHPADLDPVWTRLTNMPRAVDIVTYTISDLDLRLSEYRVTWEELAGMLAASIMASQPSKTGITVADAMYIDSFPTFDFLKELLLVNRWMTLLLILRRGSTFNLRIGKETARDSASAADGT